jgi:hypothetical protein
MVVQGAALALCTSVVRSPSSFNYGSLFRFFIRSSSRCGLVQPALPLTRGGGGWFVVFHSTRSRWWFGLPGIIIFNSVAGAAAIVVTSYLLLVIGWLFSPSEGLFLSQLSPLVHVLLFRKHNCFVCLLFVLFFDWPLVVCRIWRQWLTSQQNGCGFVSVSLAWFGFG